MKYNIVNKESIDISQTFIELNNSNWKQPGFISVELYNTLIEKTNNSNIKLFEFIDQDTSINRPPNSYPINIQMHLAYDDNFLYVWIKDRWKRIPFSSF